jgi:hypothetical protein
MITTAFFPALYRALNEAPFAAQLMKYGFEEKESGAFILGSEHEYFLLDFEQKEIDNRFIWFEVEIRKYYTEELLYSFTANHETIKEEITDFVNRILAGGIDDAGEQ